MYANYKLDTITAKGVVNQVWKAKPPAILDLSATADYTLNNVVFIGSNIFGMAADEVSDQDQIFVKSIGLFSNFADGLIFDTANDLFVKIGYTIDGTTLLDFAIWTRIAALNTMFPVNGFLPSKPSVPSAIGFPLRMLGVLNDAAGTGKFSPGPVDPDLADTGAHAAGEEYLSFDIVAEIAHTYALL